MILFPEMSITGYQREQGDILAFEAEDSRLDGLRELAVTCQMMVVAGAPVRLESGLHIGSFIIKEDGGIDIYTKRFLHGGEEPFYRASFNYNPLVRFGGQQAGLAICADIDHPDHPELVASAGATFYMASIFFTPGGIAYAHDKLSTYAKRHHLNILMANFCGESYGMAAGGGSGFWNPAGQLKGCLDSRRSGLLVVKKDNASGAEEVGKVYTEEK